MTNVDQIRHAIVGNAPLSGQNRRRIAAADHITRFNLTPNVADGDGGRTSCLVIVNRSKQISQYFKEKTYLTQAAFQRATHIAMPYDQSIIDDFFPRVTLRERVKGRRGNWAQFAKDICEETDKGFNVFSRQDYIGACNAIGFTPESRKGPFPSTGFLTIYKTLNDPQVITPVHLFGFAFSGWKRHAWTLEEGFVQAAIEQGRAVLHAGPPR